MKPAKEMDRYFCMVRKKYRDTPCDELDPKHDECFYVSEVLGEEE